MQKQIRTSMWEKHIEMCQTPPLFLVNDPVPGHKNGILWRGALIAAIRKRLALFKIRKFNYNYFPLSLSLSFCLG